jgi:hypothetical protein
MNTYVRDNTAELFGISQGLGPNVVQSVKTDTFSTASGTFTNVTGLSVTITPSSATSKVLLIAEVTGYVSDVTSSSYGFRFSGGNTSAYVGDLVGSRPQGAFGQSPGAHGGSRNQYSHVLLYLDSPATTSATTYNLQTSAPTGTVYVNFSQTDDNNNRGWRNASSIIAIEVAA